MELFYFLGGIIVIWRLLCIVLDTMHPCFHNVPPTRTLNVIFLNYLRQTKNFLCIEWGIFLFSFFLFLICTYFYFFILFYFLFAFNVNILCLEYLNIRKLEVRKEIKIIFPKVDYLHMQKQINQSLLTNYFVMCRLNTFCDQCNFIIV